MGFISQSEEKEAEQIIRDQADSKRYTNDYGKVNGIFDELAISGDYAEVNAIVFGSITITGDYVTGKIFIPVGVKVVSKNSGDYNEVNVKKVPWSKLLTIANDMPCSL